MSRSGASIFVDLDAREAYPVSDAGTESGEDTDTVDDPGSVIFWFGKYKGKRFDEVPLEYRCWCYYSRMARGLGWHNYYALVFRSYERTFPDTKTPGGETIWFGKVFRNRPFWMVYARKSWMNWLLDPKRQGNYWYYRLVHLRIRYKRWLKTHKREYRRRVPSDVVHDIGEPTIKWIDDMTLPSPDDEYERDGFVVSDNEIVERDSNASESEEEEEARTTGGETDEDTEDQSARSGVVEQEKGQISGAEGQENEDNEEPSNEQTLSLPSDESEAEFTDGGRDALPDRPAKDSEPEAEFTSGDTDSSRTKLSRKNKKVWNKTKTCEQRRQARRTPGTRKKQQTNSKARRASVKGTSARLVSATRAAEENIPARTRSRTKPSFARSKEYQNESANAGDADDESQNDEEEDSDDDEPLQRPSQRRGNPSRPVNSKRLQVFVLIPPPRTLRKGSDKQQIYPAQDLIVEDSEMDNDISSITPLRSPKVRAKLMRVQSVEHTPAPSSDETGSDTESDPDDEILRTPQSSPRKPVLGKRVRLPSKDVEYEEDSDHDPSAKRIRAFSCGRHSDDEPVVMHSPRKGRLRRIAG